jgi:hypothetical protein
MELLKQLVRILDLIVRKGLEDLLLALNEVRRFFVTI